MVIGSDNPCRLFSSPITKRRVRGLNLTFTPSGLPHRMYCLTFGHVDNHVRRDGTYPSEFGKLSKKLSSEVAHC